MSKYKIANINWVNFLFLSITPILALILGIEFFQNNQWNWHYLSFFLVSYMITGLSISAGYHRLFSHRAYLTKPWVKLFFLIFGAANFENSALNWCTDHRRHHSKVDTPEDPYNIKEGFFHAHIGWIFLKQEAQYVNKHATDLKNDPLVLWQHKYYLPIAVLTGFVLPAVLGHFLFHNALAGFLFGGLFRMIIVQHCTFFINSLCHIWGSQEYNPDNTARDNFLLAIFTYGEGYHNFHHKFEADYRNGIKWYHYDPAKWLIKSLNYLGWAKRLIKTSDAEILKAKMGMVNYKLSHKEEVNDQALNLIQQLKQQVEIRQRNWRKTKKDYENLKQEMSEKKQEILSQFQVAKEQKLEQLQLAKKEKLQQFRLARKEKVQLMKAEIQQAKLEFRLAYSQWRACTKVLQQV